MNRFRLFLSLLACGLIISASILPSYAAPLVEVVEWGVENPACDGEGVACPADPTFPAFNGGYRAGGNVSWGFNFDPSAFASISSIELEVIVIGMKFQGSIDPLGKIGNYLAIDNVAFAPFTGVTDKRDTQTFLIPSFGAGSHTFSVFAYDYPEDPDHYEGWGGVDYAKLTVTGESSGSPTVPEPTTMLLLGLGLIGLAGVRRRMS